MLVDDEKYEIISIIAQVQLCGVQDRYEISRFYINSDWDAKHKRILIMQLQVINNHITCPNTYTYIIDRYHNMQFVTQNVMFIII